MKQYQRTAELYSAGKTRKSIQNTQMNYRLILQMTVAALISCSYSVAVHSSTPIIIPEKKAEPNLVRDPFQRARQSIKKLNINTLPTTDTVPPFVQLPGPTALSQNNKTHSQVDFSNFSYEFSTNIDAFAIAAGGVLGPNPDTPEQGSSAVFGSFGLVAEFDTEKLALWENGAFFFNSMLTFGNAPAAGDLNGISDKYAGGNTLRIIEAWYKHKFPYGRSSLLFGLQDFSHEFYRLKFAKSFLNYGFKLGKPIREHGQVSTYPLTTLGLRFKSALTQNSYFQIAVFDGMPNEDALNKIVDIGVNASDAVFAVSEIGIDNNGSGIKNYYKLAFGAWYLKDEQVGFKIDIGKVTERSLLADKPRMGNGGIYLIAEKSLSEGIGVFFKHGRARKEFNRYAQYYSTGVNIQGIIPERDQDILAIGLIHTRHSNTFMDSNPNEFFIAETVLEITYSAKLTQWLTIQPDFQYIQQPNMTSPLKQANTVVIGVRASAIF